MIAESMGDFRSALQFDFKKSTEINSIENQLWSETIQPQVTHKSSSFQSFSLLSFSSLDSLNLSIL